MNHSSEKQNLLKAAVCGLYCNACSVFIGTTEDPKRLEIFAQRSGQAVSDFYCEGCRSGKLSSYCKTCTIKKCAGEKSIEFCSECNEYPCEMLKSFQAKLPHRIELFESLDSIKELGVEKWTEKMHADYSCVQCGTINSAYDLKCRKCGSFPGNEFVKRHSTEILNSLKRE